MGLDFDYSEEKDEILKSTRGVGFEEIIEAIRKGGLLDDVEHFDKKKRGHQKLLVIEINNCTYVVPRVVDKKWRVKFLKTIYPSRKMTNKYIKRR